MNQKDIIISIEKLNIKEHDLIVIKSFMTAKQSREIFSLLKNNDIKNPVLFLGLDENIKVIDRDKAVRVLKDLLHLEKKDILDEILK